MGIGRTWSEKGFFWILNNFEKFLFLESRGERRRFWTFEGFGYTSWCGRKDGDSKKTKK